jgi:hypothetical protein
LWKESFGLQHQLDGRDALLNQRQHQRQHQHQHHWRSDDRNFGTFHFGQFGHEFNHGLADEYEFNFKFEFVDDLDDQRHHRLDERNLDDHDNNDFDFDINVHFDINFDINVDFHFNDDINFDVDFNIDFDFDRFDGQQSGRLADVSLRQRADQQRQRDLTAQCEQRGESHSALGVSDGRADRGIGRGGEWRRLHRLVGRQRVRHRRFDWHSALEHAPWHHVDRRLQFALSG